MIWAAAVVLCIVFLTLTLMFVPVTVEVSFGKGIRHYQGKLRIRWLFGIVRSERRFVDIHPMMTDEGPSVHADLHHPNKRNKPNQRRILTFQEAIHYLGELRLWRRIMKRSWPTIRRFCNHIHIIRFDTRLTFGTGDAPMTGVLYGLAWAGLSTVAGQASRFCKLEVKPAIQVEPEFQLRKFDMYQCCIFRFAPGYAISAGFRVYRVWKRTVGRRRRGTSDFRSHADRDE
jgi:hypothetical protein